MPNVAKVMLEQIKPSKDIDRLVIAEAEFPIRKGSKVDVEKLCKTLTNEAFDRATAEKVTKIMRTGFAISKPFRLTVVFGNRYVFDTDKLQDNYMKTRTQSLIKIRPTAFRKDYEGEKERFYQNLLFIHQKGSKLHKSLERCIIQPKADKKPKQAAKHQTSQAAFVASNPESEAAKDKANDTATAETNTDK